MIIIIDNYDSFTYNLVHLVGQISDHKIQVIRNDAMSVEAVLALKPTAILISPGPATPDQAGICLELVKAIAKLDSPLPLLGVCLGHQTIGQAFGGNIIRTFPCHGKTSRIRHQNSGLFHGIENPLQVVRYHSLLVDSATLPPILSVDATTEEGLIMAFHHQTLPIYGVQFHPESIATKFGEKIIENFIDSF